jgi:hypothetical protein
MELEGNNMILFDDRLKSSKACIRYFIKQAIERKRFAQNVTPEFYAKSCIISQKAWDTDRTESIHVMARSSMHYTRYRALLGGLDKYPRDRPARELWFKLNPIQPVRAQPLRNDPENILKIMQIIV